MERPDIETGCAVSFLCRRTTGVDVHWKHWSVFGALANPLPRHSVTVYSISQKGVEGLRG